jgi:hypothetical protein
MITTRFKQDRTASMSAKHLAMIRLLPSCISGRKPCQAHHLQVSTERGVGMRATDKWAVPLTPDEHFDLHTLGSRLEREWFGNRGVDDPYAMALALWEGTGDHERMCRIIARFRTP